MPHLRVNLTAPIKITPNVYNVLTSQERKDGPFNMSVVKINLGTTSEDKRKYLESVLRKKLAEGFVITPMSAPSEVPDQPLTLRDTVSGSQNRARNSFGAQIDFAIGMEGGLVKSKGKLNLICAVSLYDGKNYYTGVSFETSLPQIVADKILNGEQFGEAIREYELDNKTDLVKELVTRQKSFVDATEKAVSLILR